MILLPFFAFTWIGTIGSLQSISPAPVSPLETKVSSTATWLLLSAGSAVATLSLWSTVGCLWPHLEQEIFLWQFLLMCPIHKQRKQAPFSFRKSIFCLCDIFSNRAHTSNVCPPVQQGQIFLPGGFMSAALFTGWAVLSTRFTVVAKLVPLMLERGGGLYFICLVVITVSWMFPNTGSVKIFTCFSTKLAMSVNLALLLYLSCRSHASHLQRSRSLYGSFLMISNMFVGVSRSFKYCTSSIALQHPRRKRPYSCRAFTSSVLIVGHDKALSMYAAATFCSLP